MSDGDREKLAVLLQEAQNRGIDLDISQFQEQKVDFPTDDNGYFRKHDLTEFRPRQELEDFINSNAQFVGIFSGRGGGKTTAGSQKALKKIQAGESGAIMNPSFTDFRQSTWQEFKQWVPIDTVIPSHRRYFNAEWSPQKPFYLNFLNGAQVLMKGLRDPNSARGPNINWLWYDEAGSDMTGEGWNIAIASVRVGNDPIRFITTTPNGVLHWTYQFFVEQDFPQYVWDALEEAGGDRKLIDVFHSSIEKNKENLDPGFYTSMIASYGEGWLRQQELEGKFVAQGGTLGNAEWFSGKVIDTSPLELDIYVKNRVRYWDLAATEKKIAGKKTNDPDSTVGSLVSYAPPSSELTEELSLMNHPDKQPAFFIENQHRGQWEYDDILENIWNTAVSDGHFVKIRIEQEGGSGGKNQVAAIKKWMNEKCSTEGLPRFDIEGHRPEGDKIMRANIWFSEASRGLFYLVNGLWNKNFLAILGGFPLMRHDDEIDSISGARMTVAPIKVWSAPKFLHLGMDLNGEKKDT